MGTGEAAVASNIVSLTHRIQRWDFSDAKLPDITDSKLIRKLSHYIKFSGNNVLFAYSKVSLHFLLFIMVFYYLGEANVIVGHCKLHNDASVDLSQDGGMLAVLVPSARAFPNDTIMAVFSLTEDTLGQCLYTKSFGKNMFGLDQGMHVYSMTMSQFMAMYVISVEL